MAHSMYDKLYGILWSTVRYKQASKLVSEQNFVERKTLLM